MERIWLLLVSSHSGGRKTVLRVAKGSSTVSEQQPLRVSRRAVLEDSSDTRHDNHLRVIVAVVAGLTPPQSGLKRSESESFWRVNNFADLLFSCYVRNLVGPSVGV